LREEYERALDRNGRPGLLKGEDAVEKILGAEYVESEGDVDEFDPLGLVKGQEVEVFPTDMASGFAHRDKGKLLSLTINEVVIQAMSSGGQEIRIHFPRTNFRILKAGSKL